MQSVAASLIVAFNPFTAGSPACAAMCDIPESLTTPGLVDMLDPDNSNAMIQAWLAGVAGTGAFPDNNATPEQIAASIALLQTGIFNLTPEQLDEVIGQLDAINPALPALAVNAGILTDPGYLAYVTEPGTAFDPVYGGLNPALVLLTSCNCSASTPPQRPPASTPQCRWIWARCWVGSIRPQCRQNWPPCSKTLAQH